MVAVLCRSFVPECCALRFVALRLRGSGEGVVRTGVSGGACGDVVCSLARVEFGGLWRCEEW
jgi:hypothetical protein